MTKDPVCGTQVDEKNASTTSSHQGQTYAFCGKECKDKFDRSPERYTHAKHPASSSQGKQKESQSAHR